MKKNNQKEKTKIKEEEGEGRRWISLERNIVKLKDFFIVFITNYTKIRKIEEGGGGGEEGQRQAIAYEK